MTDIVDRANNRLFPSELGNMSTNWCSHSCVTGRGYTPSVLGVSRAGHETGYTSCAGHRRLRYLTDIVDRADNRLLPSKLSNMSTNWCSHSCITGRGYTPSVLGVSRAGHETGYTSCAGHRRIALQD